MLIKKVVEDHVASFETFLLRENIRTAFAYLFEIKIKFLLGCLVLRVSLVNIHHNKSSKKYDNSSICDKTNESIRRG